MLPPVQQLDDRIWVRGPTLFLLIFAICLPACVRRPEAQATFDHAMSTFQHGDMETAAKEAETGYRLFHEVDGDWGWRFTILRAKILRWRGANDAMLNLLSSQSGPLPSGALAVEKQRLESVAYVSLRRFPEAERGLAQAESLCTVSDYPSCTDVIRARGILAMSLSNYREARRQFALALASARSRSDKFLEANASLDLSWWADRQAYFDEALEWADVARRIAVPQGFDGIAQTALGNEGWAYYKLGDTERGRQSTIEAWKEAKKHGDQDDEVKWLTNAGLIDMDAGNLSDAESTFHSALDLAIRIKSREDIINSLIVLAFISEQINKLDDAKRYADEALAMAQADKNGRDQVYPRLVQGRLAARLHDNTTAENTFREVAQSPNCPVFLKWEAERSLARLYEDESQLDSAGREYQIALTSFETARSELKHEDSRLPFLRNAARIYDDYIHFLVAQGKSAEALQVADFSRGRTLAEGLGLLQKGPAFNPNRMSDQEKNPREKNAQGMNVQAMDPQAVARRAGGTILFYWLGEKHSYLWTVTPQTTSLSTLPPGSQIDAAVQRYREALAGPQDVLSSADSDGQSLYRMLIAPAHTLLKKDAKVFIIPDGSLNNLNFETLLVSDSKLPEAKPTEAQLPATTPSSPSLHSWIEDVTIANASSLRILGASRPNENANRNNNKEKPTRTLLLVGNSIAPNDKYPQLPQAAAQMQSVARHFPAAEETIFTQQAATPSAYLEGNPERFSYIHFVAHGTASRLSPLDSAIVLSKASAEDDSFKLYARDIIRHPLRANLVTISACYSAGERSYSGEGLVGLSWAFLRAGAHNVIAALWDASDVSTQLLMDKFYDELDRGASPDAALRAAKLSLLRNRAFHNPFYWAPFQLYARLN
jgi:CHAT domain-containing protein